MLPDDETVMCSWIVDKSRKHRDGVHKKLVADPRIAAMASTQMPFDGKRMFWGRFKSLVEL